MFPRLISYEHYSIGRVMLCLKVILLAISDDILPNFPTPIHTVELYHFKLYQEANWPVERLDTLCMSLERETTLSTFSSRAQIKVEQGSS